MVEEAVPADARVGSTVTAMDQRRACDARTGQG